MDDLKAKNGWGCWISLLLGIGSLPLLYVRSVGPVAWLVYHDYLPRGPWATVYAPLGWLARNSSWFKEFYVWYMQLWGG
jgi:hypothetical protein